MRTVVEISVPESESSQLVPVSQLLQFHNQSPNVFLSRIMNRACPASFRPSAVDHMACNYYAIVLVHCVLSVYVILVSLLDSGQFL
jgi:hypothetical protein